MDTVWLALRVIVSLGAVFGALWFGHRWVTKGRPGLRMPVKAISVAARQGLGAKAGVAIVEADGRRYLLGVTEHAVTVLDRLDGETPHQPQQQTTLAVVATGPVPAVGGQETRVVSVVTTGPVSTERLAAQAVAGAAAAAASAGGTAAPGPIGAWAPGPSRAGEHDAPQGGVASVHRGSFEQELAIAASFTAAIGLPGLGREPERQPEVLRIQPSRTTPGADPGQPLTRRAAREAHAARGARTADPAEPAKPSPLAGSILSPETWRQTAAALKRAR